MSDLPEEVVQRGAEAAGDFMEGMLEPEDAHWIAEAVVRAVSETIPCPATMRFPRGTHYRDCVCGGSGSLLVIRSDKEAE